ncbi:hypothetical protein B0T24DRAFT_198962 [Lasiosphaeria ovina]|uniref:Indole-diterpene biosynthesis protein PaxU n=1 Tax=Lasiosphaeria ovina TaxID=92902 RepID=A0AAE0TV74_9PEZI|nr:hypothetical protein B0T24DRAFT_198962 [Lasiosphaeria ovina]
MAFKTAAPLGFMEKLSNSVLLYRPVAPPASAAAVTITNATPTPKAILIFGWMDARDAPLAKFVNQYRSLYPSSAILLVKARGIATGFARLGRQDAAGAVAPLRALFPDDADDDNTESPPQLLIHAFSGGGSCMLYHMYQAYAATAPPSSPAVLPRHVTVFDSTPGEWSWAFNVNVFAAGMRSRALRLAALPFLHTMAAVLWMCIRVFGMVDTQRTWRDAHNDSFDTKKDGRRGVVRETRRAYIYSDVDKICARAAVEAHADDAAARGFCVWRRELFHGSGHVAHAKADPDRYWRIVQEMWAGRQL